MAKKRVGSLKMPPINSTTVAAAIVGVVGSLFVPQIVKDLIKPDTGVDSAKKNRTKGILVAIGTAAVAGYAYTQVKDDTMKSFLGGLAIGSAASATPFISKVAVSPYAGGYKMAGTGMGEAVSDDLLSLDLDSIGAADDNTILREYAKNGSIRTT